MYKANFNSKSKQNHLHRSTSQLKINHCRVKEFQLFLVASPPTGNS